MPVTHHAPPPISLSKDEKPVPISKSSPPSKVLDIRPIVSNQPSRESPPPSLKPLSRPETPKPVQPPLRSSPPREVTPQAEPAPAEPEPEQEDVIDMETFQQILELDDSEEDREFSRDMVWAYFSQAEKTSGDLDKALGNKNLTELSALGHYLKGSSAALGVTRVQDACEKIQHYGQLRDEETDKNLTADQALGLIQKTLDQMKFDYVVAERWLRRYYDEDKQDS